MLEVERSNNQQSFQPSPVLDTVIATGSRAKRSGSSRRQRHLSADGSPSSSDQLDENQNNSKKSLEDARGQHRAGKGDHQDDLLSRRKQEPAKEDGGQQDDQEDDENEKQQTKLYDDDFKPELVWRNIILFIILHSCLPIGIYMLYSQRPWRTLIFSIVGMYISGLGVTGGAHRLWSHRSYKARLPVQLTLIVLQTMAGQNSIYTWCRDHRLHHKFSETNADPHNIKRGFFFAHMGWLCCRKHPAVKEKGKLIDMSDLEANKLVMFQHHHFWWMSILFTVLVPTMIPVLLWGERFWTSFVFSFMIRYLITLHGTWLVNSAAHYYGTKPYDVNIEAVESPYAIYNGLGEGFHNYHHTFPYDYATSEFGRYFNITTAFIDACAFLGLVLDRKKVDHSTIIKRRLRTGDLTEEMLRQMELESSKQLPVVKEEQDEASTGSTATRRPLLNNLIHELPYISGLTSMKYTM